MQPIKWNDVKENDRIKLNDYFDVDTSPENTAKNQDSDLHYGLGHYKLRSISDLEIIKTNGKLLPSGTVKHSIEDKYDFNPGTALGTIARPLELLGMAKPFTSKTHWQTRPWGVIQLKDNKIDASGLE